MIQIEKSHLCAQPLLINEDLKFEDSYFPTYPIAGVEKLHLNAEFSKDKTGRISTHFQLEGTIKVFDSYTNEVFAKKIKEEASFDILEEEDGESEGFILPGRSIDVLELTLLFIKFSLPIKILKKGSKLPKGGEGYRVISSDEVGEDKEEHSSPFDSLKDIDF